MIRTVDTIAADLARAQERLEAAETAFAEAARAESDAAAGLSGAEEARDALRLELREAIRQAGDHWPDPGRAA